MIVTFVALFLESIILVFGLDSERLQQLILMPQY